MTRRMATVVFDCDSTLVEIEGIEYLARAHREQIQALTDAAMRGDVPLEEVYGRRLELVRPDRRALDELSQAYVDTLLPDAREAVAALAASGVAVRVLSGGLLPAVVHVAAELGIPARDVEAVGVRFEGDAWAGFDTASPLARAGGKRDAIQAWTPALPRPVMLVGDGATDLEAAGAVDAFVAFAGVVERTVVTGAADAVVRARSLAPVVPLALGAVPPAPPHHAVWERGLALLDDATRNEILSTRDER